MAEAFKGITVELYEAMIAVVDERVKEILKEGREEGREEGGEEGREGIA
ncbi:hypothetical protein M1N22_03580 [Dehalococcoidia bacterium]|nr:hypothetical protein [Dehalococcoidia bacterium]